MQEIKLENLDDGPGVLPFKLGPCNMVSHYHSFLQHVDVHELQEKVNLVQTQLNNISPHLNNNTLSLFEPHIEYLKEKLQTVLDQLQSFEISRSKRGLIDGLGSVVKSITGNLDYTDALRFNNAIKSLQDNDNKLLAEFNNHVSLTKDWVTQHSKIIDNIVDNQNKLAALATNISQSLEKGNHELIQYAHLGQTILIVSDNVDRLSQEITKLQNVLAFIRASTAHHDVISLNSISTIVKKLRSIYGSNKVLDIGVREYYDIIQLGSYYIGNEIVIVYKFPIILSQIYNLYKISIVPNKNHEILVPHFQFLAIHLKDFKYIEAECPKSTKGYLCEEIHNIYSRTSPDCIAALVSTQQRLPECKPVAISLQKPAYEKLDDRHYTISFPAPTRIRLSCGQDLYKMLQGSYLAIIPHNCFIQTTEFTISNLNDRLKGQALKIIDVPKEDTSSPAAHPTFRLNSINLTNLHATNKDITLQPPVHFNKDNDSGSIYHTTIPLYTLLFGACALTIGLAYRRYRLKRTIPGKEHSHEMEIQQQSIYAIPDTERNEPDHLPAQFTTKVFNSRCSTGGGVTQA